MFNFLENNLILNNNNNNNNTTKKRTYEEFNEEEIFNGNLLSVDPEEFFSEKENISNVKELPIDILLKVFK